MNDVKVLVKVPVCVLRNMQTSDGLLKAVTDLRDGQNVPYGYADNLFQSYRYDEDGLIHSNWSLVEPHCEPGHYEHARLIIDDGGLVETRDVFLYKANLGNHYRLLMQHKATGQVVVFNHVRIEPTPDFKSEYYALNAVLNTTREWLSLTLIPGTREALEAQTTNWVSEETIPPFMVKSTIHDSSVDGHLSPTMVSQIQLFQWSAPSPRDTMAEWTEDDLHDAVTALEQGRSVHVGKGYYIFTVWAVTAPLRLVLANITRGVIFDISVDSFSDREAFTASLKKHLSRVEENITIQSDKSVDPSMTKGQLPASSKWGLTFEGSVVTLEFDTRDDLLAFVKELPTEPTSVKIKRI